MAISRGMSADEVRKVLANRPAARTAMTGAAGEYYVAAELSLRGWLATVTIKNAPATDILAQHPTSGMIVAIQTKTASPGNKFQLNKKAESPGGDANNEWYVLVRLHGLGKRPTFYVVPRDVVAAAAYAQHREWLSKPRRDGQPRGDGTQRVMIPEEFADYADRWDLLEAPSQAAPLLLGDWYRECVRRFGFPSGHAGWETE